MDEVQNGGGIETRINSPTVIVFNLKSYKLFRFKKSLFIVCFLVKVKSVFIYIYIYVSLCMHIYVCITIICWEHVILDLVSLLTSQFVLKQFFFSNFMIYQYVVCPNVFCATKVYCQEDDLIKGRILCI